MSRNNIEGEAVVEFIIDKSGEVRTAKVVRASAGEFGQAALEAVKQWKFKPGQIDGQSVEVRASQLLEFNLDNGPRGDPRDRLGAQKPLEPGSVEPPPMSAESQAAETMPAGKLPPGGKPPKAISQTPPWYPPQMARAGLIAEVSVDFVIDTEGYVRNPIVVESNNPWFERPAIDAILTWRFSPGEIKGRKVNVRGRQKMLFELGGGGRNLEVWKVNKGKDHAKLPPEFRWETPPTPKLTLFPVYPRELLEKGITGKVQVTYIIGPQGRVIASKVHTATTPEMGLAVLAMLDAWRFTPPKNKAGESVHARLGTEYEFKPSGMGDVPVMAGTSSVLRALKKSPESIVTPKQLDAPLKPLSRTAPVYPSALLKEGQAGEAMIEFFIDKNGDAQLPSIVSSTVPEFGYAAVQAVATWRFEVPKVGGKKVIVKARIPMNFAPKEKPAAPTPVADEN